MRSKLFFILTIISLWSLSANSQCSNFTITVGGGTWDGEISWQLLDGGVTIASGIAPTTTTVCLDDGCYDFNLIDSYGDGWNGATYAITDINGVIDANGTLIAGYGETQEVCVDASPPPPCAYEEYTIIVAGGTFESEITWNIDNAGAIIASGGAPSTIVVCLDDSQCYNFNMTDSFGDGWNGATYTITNESGVVVESGNLDNADSGDGSSWGTDIVCLTPPPPCAFEEFTLTVGGGTFDYEISWAFSPDGGAQITNGGAPSTTTLCLDDGCYTILMLDDFGDGWNGATYTLTNSGGTVIGTGTLAAGTGPELGYFEIGTGICDIPPPPDPTQQDCAGGITICDDSAFGGNSDGSGVTVDLNGSNQGCLAGGEHQSNWFFFSPTTTGTIEFSLSPTGGIDYDFAIWGPYTEGAVPCPPTEQPIRCSFSALYQNTGLNTSLNLDGDTGSEGAGGDAWVDAITITNAELDMVYIMLIDNWTSDNTAYSIDWELDGVILDCSIQLPVEWLEFEGETKKDHNEIWWTTASELNNSHFDVERSLDGFNWERIHKVDGQGTTHDVTKYLINDNTRPFGTSYYRLKQVDYNGVFDYSNIIGLTHEGDFDLLSVYPNPTKGNLNLNMNTAKECAITISIVDLAGREILNNEVFLEKGVTNLNLDITTISKGIYSLNIYSSDNSSLAKEKLIKK